MVAVVKYVPPMSVGWLSAAATADSPLTAMEKPALMTMSALWVLIAVNNYASTLKVDLGVNAMQDFSSTLIKARALVR